MTASWITLSTEWSLSSCQAALNVVISVVGTVAIWAFGRYFWQRGCAQVIDNDKKSHVRLPKLLTIASPGESWDLVLIQRTKVLARENWHLLLQVIVIIVVTIGLMLSGPIAKGSLRTGRSILPRNIDVLQTMKGGGYFGNLLNANVLWNETMKSLENAKFPTDQMLDYLPTSTQPWMFNAKEWDPTWIVSCNNTPITPLDNVTGTGDGNMFNPFVAFPRFRDTYEPHWFSTSYRIDSNFDSWYNWNLTKSFRRVFFYVIIQSDPVIGDRMYTNNDTLQISITCFDTANFAVNTINKQNSGEETWFPVGLVDNVTYTRSECNISRSPTKRVLHEDLVPWIWTNNTWSIAMGYRTFWQSAMSSRVSRGLEPPVLDAATLFRYYQAYMVNTNTNHALPTPRIVSIWVDTVELSIAFLAVVVLLGVASVISSIRYFFFLARHRKNINAICVPDGKLEWMIHAAKAAAEDEENQHHKKDRDYFSEGLFGQVWLHENLEKSNNETEPSAGELRQVATGGTSMSDPPTTPRIARVRTSRGSLGSIYPSVYATRTMSIASIASSQTREETHPATRNGCKRLSSVAEGDGQASTTHRPEPVQQNSLFTRRRQDEHSLMTRKSVNDDASGEEVSPLDLPSGDPSLLEGGQTLTKLTNDASVPDLEHDQPISALSRSFQL